MKVFILVIVGVIAISILGYATFTYKISQTKLASPEKTDSYQDGKTSMSVFYCSPSKKDRKIFGELVPYNEVWRTGANEATTFTFNYDIFFDDIKVPAGTYTVFTIPTEAYWTVILNSKSYKWGINYDGTPIRDPAYDVASVKAMVNQTKAPVENFTIEFEHRVNLSMSWDYTKITVPISYTP